MSSDSTSVTKMQHSTTVLTWEIENLDMILNMNNQPRLGHVDSDEFEVGVGTGLHSKWMFRLMGDSQNGLRDRDNAVVLGVIVSRFCIPYDDPKRFKYDYDDPPIILCKYDVSFRTSKGEPPFTTVSRPRYCHCLENDEPVDIPGQIPMEIPWYERTSIMPIADFRAQQFPDNRLMVEIKMTLIFQPQHCKKTTLDSAKLAQEGAVISLRDFYKSLLNDQRFSDVVISCRDDTRIPAHKLVLHGRNSWFRTRLNDVWVAAAQANEVNNDNGGNLIDMTDEEPETVRRVLRFIYGAEMDLPEASDTEGLLQLIKAADKYDISDLKTAAFYKMISEMNDDNAGRFTVAAYLHNADEEVKSLVQMYCIRRHEELVKEPEYKDLYCCYTEAFLRMPGIQDENSVPLQ